MKSLLFISLLILAGSVYGQQKQLTQLNGHKIATQEIDNIVSRLMDTARVTGLALSVLNNHTIAYTKAYGLKNKDANELLDTATVMGGASLSKAVFGYLSLLLVQEAMLELDKPLYQYLDKPLPEYADYADLAGDERWKMITARMCLSHSTGFPNWRFLNARKGMFEPDGKLAIYFTPGTRYAYSGEGIALIQMIIEKITGKNLEELAIEKVFKPIGMYRTSYTWQARFENDFAYGHKENGEMTGRKRRKKPGAAGSLETTIADYARFIEYIMQGKGLQQQWRQEMLSSQIPIYSKYQFPTISDDSTKHHASIELAYGLGWGIFKSKYGKAFFKEGHDDDGWQHYAVSFIDKGISLILMTNSLNGEKVFKEALEKIIGDAFTPWQWERYIPYNFNPAMNAH